jgi:hypothetical protein
MIMLSILMCFVMLEVDEALKKPGVLKPWLIYTGSLEGTRTILSTIAASMITMAGVVFSITLLCSPSPPLSSVYKAQIQEELDLEDVEKRYEAAAAAILGRDSEKEPLATGRKSEVILTK